MDAGNLTDLSSIQMDSSEREMLSHLLIQYSMKGFALFVRRGYRSKTARLLKVAGIHTAEAEEYILDELEDIRENYDDEQVDDDLEEAYFMRSSSNIRVGNRRWGVNGYVRSERKEDRPVMSRPFINNGAGPSQGPKKNNGAEDILGRRAKRALKREAADKAAAMKHEQHLQRLGWKLKTGPSGVHLYRSLN